MWDFPRVTPFREAVNLCCPEPPSWGFLMATLGPRDGTDGDLLLPVHGVRLSGNLQLLRAGGASVTFPLPSTAAQMAGGAPVRRGISEELAH